VTTPPSKGLVVELYLIYFGLAQSFVDAYAISLIGFLLSIDIVNVFYLDPGTVLTLRALLASDLQKWPPWPPSHSQSTGYGYQ
jgi:hypothetical protein